MPTTLHPTEEPDVFLAESESTPGRRYIVRVTDPLNPTCNCTAGSHQRECKHVVAALAMIAGGTADPLSVPIPSSDPYGHAAWGTPQAPTTALARREAEAGAIPAAPPLPAPTRTLVTQRAAMIRQQASYNLGIWQDVMALAQSMNGAKMLPAGITTAQDATILLMRGIELGFSAMESLDFLYVVNGKVRCEARGMLTLISRQPGCRIQLVKRTNEAAIVRGYRPGWDPVEVSFTSMDAELAKLKGKDGPWKQYPADMLYWKAVARLARVMFADIISGMDIGASLGEGEAVDIDMAAEPSSGTFTVLPSAPARSSATESMLDATETTEYVRRGSASDVTNYEVPAPQVDQATGEILAGETPSDWWEDLVAKMNENGPNGVIRKWEHLAEAIGISKPQRTAIQKWVEREGGAAPVAVLIGLTDQIALRQSANPQGRMV